jgi:hypothetical protein
MSFVCKIVTVIDLLAGGMTGVGVGRTITGTVGLAASVGVGKRGTGVGETGRVAHAARKRMTVRKEIGMIRLDKNSSEQKKVCIRLAQINF